MINIGSVTKDIKEQNSQIIKCVEVDWLSHSKIIIEIARKIEPNYTLLDIHKPIYKLFLLYFTGNLNFINEYNAIYGDEGSLSKGLMLIGGVGTGKSLIFKVFKEYTKNILKVNSFQYHECLSIIDNVNIQGVKYLENYNDNFSGKTAMPITCYLDDIAAKNETVKNFGTDINAIEQLLSIRYNVYSRYKKLTHCTTNKYNKELKNIYDFRVIDRMREMFNIIEMPGDSFR